MPRSEIHQSVAPWKFRPQIAHESSGCRVSEIFIIDIAGAKPPDDRLAAADQLDGSRG
jgi:hypothetical protein